MVSNLKLALGDALAREYAWIDGINTAEQNHQFSPEFEERMQKIIDELVKSERKYVHVGRRRIRHALLIAVVAVMLLGLVACAVVLARPAIVWNETYNDTFGTLDITFDIDYPDGSEEPPEFKCIKPKRPRGYRITVKEQTSSFSFQIWYENSDGQLIIYSQDGNIENMGFGINIKEAEFHEVTINGHKGYSWSYLDNNAITWSDGIYLYDIGGTADMEIIEKMARSIP